MGMVRSILSGEEIEMPEIGLSADASAEVYQLLADARSKAMAEARQQVQLELAAAEGRALTAETQRDAALSAKASAESFVNDLRSTIETLQRNIEVDRAEDAVTRESSANELQKERSRFQQLDSLHTQTINRLSAIEASLTKQNKVVEQLKSQQPITLQTEPVPSFRFIPKRNHDGMIMSVDAVPIGDK